MQWMQRNVQKIAMHLQSCHCAYCFLSSCGRHHQSNLTVLNAIQGHHFTTLTTGVSLRVFIKEGHFCYL